MGQCLELNWNVGVYHVLKDYKLPIKIKIWGGSELLQCVWVTGTWYRHWGDPWVPIPRWVLYFLNIVCWYTITDDIYKVFVICWKKKCLTWCTIYNTMLWNVWRKDNMYYIIQSLCYMKSSEKYVIKISLYTQSCNFCIDKV